MKQNCWKKYKCMIHTNCSNQQLYFLDQEGQLKKYATVNTRRKKHLNYTEISLNFSPSHRKQFKFIKSYFIKSLASFHNFDYCFHIRIIRVLFYFRIFLLFI